MVCAATVMKPKTPAIIIRMTCTRAEEKRGEESVSSRPWLGYAQSGTDVAHGPTHSLGDVRYRDGVWWTKEERVTVTILGTLNVINLPADRGLQEDEERKREHTHTCTYRGGKSTWRSHTHTHTCAERGGGGGPGS
eukprot:453080-Rhodomonas_salina.1